MRPNDYHPPRKYPRRGSIQRILDGLESVDPQMGKRAAVIRQWRSDKNFWNPPKRNSDGSLV